MTHLTDAQGVRLFPCAMDKARGGFALGATTCHLVDEWGLFEKYFPREAKCYGMMVV